MTAGVVGVGGVEPTAQTAQTAQGPPPPARPVLAWTGAAEERARHQHAHPRPRRGRRRLFFCRRRRLFALPFRYCRRCFPPELYLLIQYLESRR